MALNTDSGDYNLLTEAAEAIKGVPGLTCEIGLRGGGGSAYIMAALHNTDQMDRTHIAIDPYGNIEYESHQGLLERLDYTNSMRNQCMKDIYDFSEESGINFLFFPLEDTEFFKRYADGVPVYQEYKKIIREYALVHFDGPHAWVPLVDEVIFFDNRTMVGGYWIFDDVTFYDHDKFEAEYILPRGFELVKRTNIKASYKKVCHPDG